MAEAVKVLLVEDDEDVRLGAEQALELAGMDVESFESAERMRARLAPGLRAVIVSDVRMPGMSGLDLLTLVTDTDRDLPVILVTGHGDISMAVGAMRRGAYDFIEKPFSSDHLVEVVQRAMEKRKLTLEVDALRRQLENRRGLDATILGHSPAMEKLRRTLLATADTSADVLIYGETGTGKELVARSLHDMSRRRDAHFVAVNCGGLPETLFESEIFGFEAGAFTGAARARVGKLEHAHGGTLFLDEIESMPVSLQIKLLRVLQDRHVERLGSNKPVPFDARVVAASKEDLLELSQARKFREDLYYRLNVVTIELPPLRERREDIPLLFEHMVLAAAERYGRPAPQATSAQMHELLAYPWPGNVRELRNVADRFVLGLLDEQFKLSKTHSPEAKNFSEQVDRFERALIQAELRRQNGLASAAADALGLPKKTLYDKMRRFGLMASDFK